MCCEFCGSGPVCVVCGRGGDETDAPPTIPAALAGAVAAAVAGGGCRAVAGRLPIPAGKLEELRAGIHDTVFEILHGAVIDHRPRAA